VRRGSFETTLFHYADRVDRVSFVNPLELEAGVLWALAEEAVGLLRDISDVGR